MATPHEAYFSRGGSDRRTEYIVYATCMIGNRERPTLGRALGAPEAPGRLIEAHIREAAKLGFHMHAPDMRAAPTTRRLSSDHPQARRDRR
jgi:hypothetical protein